jgi:hypothetical protein
MAAIDSNQIGWRFGLRWVLLTTAGWAIGFPLGFILGELALDNAGIEICVGAMVGLMQWLVLRRVVKKAGFWVLASITGFIVSSSIHTAACYFWKIPDDLGHLPGVMAWTLSFILGGTLTGLLQQPILRRQVCRSGWGVPASAAGWGLSVIGLAIIYFILPVMGKGPAPFVLLLIRNLIVPTVLGAGLLGIVTGGVLIWLLRQPKQQMLDTAN